MLSLGAPLGLLGLLALPAILGIHLLRRRSPPRRVTGLFLYGPPQPAATGGRSPEPLRWPPSLWCELAAALLATALLADLHWTGSTPARSLVIVLDDRLRMTAANPSGDSAAARVRRDVDRMLAGLGTDDRVSLVASGDPPRLLAGPEATPEAARRHLAAWRPAAAWHEPAAALALGFRLAATRTAEPHPREGGELWWAGDRVPTDLPPQAGILARGEPLAARVLGELDWRRDAAGDRLAIRQQGAAPRRGIRIDDDLVVPAPAEDFAEIPLPPAVAQRGSLKVALTGWDPLPSQAVVLRPEERVVRVSTALPARAGVERILAALPGVQPGGAAPHLVIGGPALPGAWSLAVTAGPATPVLGPFLTRRGHALVADLDATGCLWSGGSPLTTLPATATVLLAGGDTVLLSEERRGPDHLVTVHADLAAGTLLQHPCWPALIAATVEARRGVLPGIAQPNRRLGESFTAYLPAAAPVVRLTGPDGDHSDLPADDDGAVVIPGATHAGDYLLTLAGAPFARFHAEALDPRMADLGPAVTVDRPAAGQEVRVERRRHPAETLVPVVLIAGLLLAAALLFRQERG